MHVNSNFVMYMHVSFGFFSLYCKQIWLRISILGLGKTSPEPAKLTEPTVTGKTGTGVTNDGYGLKTSKPVAFQVGAVFIFETGKKPTDRPFTSLALFF